MNSRQIGFTICLSVTLLLWVSCSEENPKRRIRVKHDFNAMRIVNPHAWNSTTLTVNGKEFKGVTGLKPFYLETTNQNAILFVTRAAGSSTLHIFNFVSNHTISVNLGAVSFGDAIGLNRPGDRDFIESWDSNHLALASMFLNRKTIWHVDLERRAVTHKEVLDFNKSGSATNRTIVPLGE